MTDYNSLSLDELRTLLAKKKQQAADFKNEEQGVKLTLNSIYGSLGNPYFSFFNLAVAESVTLQGQDLIKFAEKVLNKYFQEHWHLDTELHEHLKVRNVKKIIDDVIIYIDTDSGPHEMVIRIQTSDGEEKEIQIGELYLFLMHSSNIKFDNRGNEIIENPIESILNYKNGNLKYSAIKKLIRHKVTKSKWKITTETGKFVIVTGDHSITVFRNNKKITVKPSEINIETDRVLEIFSSDNPSR